MKLDRNTNPDGHGKYALVKLRDANLQFTETKEGDEFAHINSKHLDFGDTPDSEFFVIRLKDKYAANALRAYATSCKSDDPEFAREVLQLALRAQNHPNQKKPD